VAVLAGKYAEIRPHLDERAWRLYLGSEARAYAAGGGSGLAVAVVAGAAGVSRATGTPRSARGNKESRRSSRPTIATPSRRTPTRYSRQLATPR
jgi:hypothetical protein